MRIYTEMSGVKAVLLKKIVVPKACHLIIDVKRVLRELLALQAH